MQNISHSGYTGSLFLVDGSPDFLFAMLALIINFKSDEKLQNSLICHVLDLLVPNNEITATLMEKLDEIESYDDRVKYATDICAIQHNYSNQFISNISKSCFYRLKIIINSRNEEIKKIKTPITLLRPKETPPFVTVEDNYGLDKITEGAVTVHFLEGNHHSILENKDCANIINRVVTKNAPNVKTESNVVTNMVEKQRSVQV